MKRRFTIIAAISVVVLLMLLILPGVSAQNIARANIPFTFAVNHTVLPAGCYQVKILSDTILALAGCEGRNTALAVTHTASAYAHLDHGSLVFRVTPRGYRLIQARFAGSNLQSDLPVPHLRSESELARNDVSKTTEIALK